MRKSRYTELQGEVHKLIAATHFQLSRSSCQVAGFGRCQACPRARQTPQTADRAANALQLSSCIAPAPYDVQLSRCCDPADAAIQARAVGVRWQQSTPPMTLQTPMILIGSSSGLRYCRLMCSLGSPNTMLLPPPGGFRTRSDDRCDSCKCGKLVRQKNL